MKRLSRHPLLFGTALLTLASAALYGCKDFLSSNANPQGTLDATVLESATGVEGNLIAAYRALDCVSSTEANWGCAASNWVWGSVASDDAYKGSEASDQPAINDIEAYHWSTADAESYLNDKWRHDYEGVVRSNSTLRLLKQVQTEAAKGTPESYYLFRTKTVKVASTKKVKVKGKTIQKPVQKTVVRHSLVQTTSNPTEPR